MISSNIIKNKAFGIVLVQLFSKIAGIFREIILANFFGSSVIFSDFLKLMTFGELVSIFCTEGGLGANLMKKFSLMHRRGNSFRKIKIQSVLILFIVFFLVSILQFLAWKFVVKSNYNFTLIILISSLTSAIVFYFNIGQIILISSSNYSNLYKSHFFRSFIYLLFLYPCISFFNIVGAALNRLIAVLSQYFNTWYAVDKKFAGNSYKSIGFSQRDFNLWVFVTNNSLFFWFILIRVYFSFSIGVEIIFLTYGFILASSFDGVIIKSFSTYLLERSVNMKIDIKKSLFLISIFSFLIILISVFVGEYIINFIFGYTGNFNQSEIHYIYLYFILLLILVCTNGINNLVFQKIFAGRRKIQFHESKKYTITSMIAFILISILAFFEITNLTFVTLIVISFSMINLFYIFKLLKYERAII
jgi:hypothetical protein